MFTLKDGRDFLYQWDIDRQIIVDDQSIVEVHFCNRTDDCSLVVEVVDGIANVPNVILQKSFNVRVFGYDGKATRYDKVFEVKARSKPSDYVYTEVEIKRYEDLNKRIDEIEKNGISEEVITEAVENYLEKNPVDLTGYATEDYVDKAIDAIPEVDLEPYAKKEDIPDIRGKADKEHTHSQYALKTDIPDVSDFISEIPSEYITESELEAKGYATGGYVDSKIAGIVTPDLTPYAKKSDIPTVPTKVSAFENDKGYLTEHIDISGKADKEHTHTEYADKTHKHSLNDITDYVAPEIPSLDGYATEKYVDDAIAGIEIPEGGEGADLSNYYTKTETDELLADINECDTYFFNPYEVEWPTGLGETLASDHVAEFAQRFIAGEAVGLYIAWQPFEGGAIRWYPAEFLIDTDHNRVIVCRTITHVDVGRETVLQQYTITPSTRTEGAWKLNKFMTTTEFIPDKQYVDDAIAAIEIPEGGDVDLSNYYTKEETTQAIQNALNAIGVAEGGSY